MCVPDAACTVRTAAVGDWARGDGGRGRGVGGPPHRKRILEGRSEHVWPRAAATAATRARLGRGWDISVGRVGRSSSSRSRSSHRGGGWIDALQGVDGHVTAAERWQRRPRARAHAEVVHDDGAVLLARENTVRVRVVPAAGPAGRGERVALHDGVAGGAHDAQVAVKCGGQDEAVWPRAAAHVAHGPLMHAHKLDVARVQ
jgi:hypothetical protein